MINGLSKHLLLRRTVGEGASEASPLFVAAGGHRDNGEASLLNDIGGEGPPYPDGRRDTGEAPRRGVGDVDTGDGVPPVMVLALQSTSRPKLSRDGKLQNEVLDLSQYYAVSHMHV